MAKNFIKGKCLYVVLTLFLITCGLIWFSHEQYTNSKELVEEVEYYDSLNRYNKIYYTKAFDILKKENKQLYDSLKQYRDKIDYIVQFYHEKGYNTGKVIIKHDSIHDTITVDKPLVAQTYKYDSEPNDTFQYHLDVNAYMEPNWYSIQAKVKNKFTIVNKEDNGVNHIVIDPSNGGTISDVTVYKKDNQKKSFWDRLSFGPGITAGYDPINRNWGVIVGATASYDLK